MHRKGYKEWKRTKFLLIFAITECNKPSVKVMSLSLSKCTVNEDVATDLKGRGLFLVGAPPNCWFTLVFTWCASERWCFCSICFERNDRLQPENTMSEKNRQSVKSVLHQCRICTLREHLNEHHSLAQWNVTDKNTVVFLSMAYFTSTVEIQWTHLQT